jgi:dTDP-glucose pyrophosphorylase
MKAVILAAGKGTRMGELTNECPKPMLLVQGKPILHHIIDGLHAAEISQVLIVVGHRAEIIQKHFGNGAASGVEISYGVQTVQDGTGKAPEVAKEFVGTDDFLLTYGDILVRPDNYRRILARFREGPFSGLVTVTAGEDVTKGGINFFDDSFCLTRLVEKPTAAQLEELRRAGFLKPGNKVWYNAGIYVFKPVVYEFTARLQKSVRGEYELTDALNAMIGAGHRVGGLEIDGRWVDVRDPEVLRSLQQETSSGGDGTAP